MMSLLLRWCCRSITLFSPRSLHDALPISLIFESGDAANLGIGAAGLIEFAALAIDEHRIGALGCNRLHHQHRSEEHTSELQSPCNLVCRLLLEKTNRKNIDCLVCPLELII